MCTLPRTAANTVLPSGETATPVTPSSWRKTVPEICRARALEGAIRLCCVTGVEAGQCEQGCQLRLATCQQDLARVRTETLGACLASLLLSRRFVVLRLLGGILGEARVGARLLGALVGESGVVLCLLRALRGERRVPVRLTGKHHGHAG